MTKTTILALAGAISGLLMAAPAVSAADAMPKVKPFSPASRARRRGSPSSTATC